MSFIDKTMLLNLIKVHICPPFDKCVAQYTFGDFGNQKVIKDKVKTSAEWKIGDVYDIKNDNIKCKIISLRAYGFQYC
jgi:hypothetical protein